MLSGRSQQQIEIRHTDINGAEMGDGLLRERRGLTLRSFPGGVSERSRPATIDVIGGVEAVENGRTAAINHTVSVRQRLTLIRPEIKIKIIQPG